MLAIIHVSEFCCSRHVHFRFPSMDVTVLGDLFV